MYLRIVVCRIVQSIRALSCSAVPDCQGAMLDVGEQSGLLVWPRRRIVACTVPLVVHLVKERHPENVTRIT
jgi:hypothetical protein